LPKKEQFFPPLPFCYSNAKYSTLPSPCSPHVPPDPSQRLGRPDAGEGMVIMVKFSSTRWNDTINYLNTKFPHAKIGDHINTAVTGAMRTTISDQLSLGSNPLVHPASDASKGARNALRGLLLCQRVYFSDLWSCSSVIGGDTVKWSYLDSNWKIASLTYWGRQSEQSILSAIAMFAPVSTATAKEVSDVAKLGWPWPKTPSIAGNLKLSRNNFPLTGPSETCYRGVLAWLLKAGVISFRWFMKNSAPTGSKALNALFGAGEVVWDSNQPFKDDSVLPAVEAGFVIHMWDEDMGEGAWNGHWVISNGDGTVCGVNNGEVDKEDEVVQKDYTNNGKLRSQFEGYGGYAVKEVMNEKTGFLELVRREPLRYRKAKMVKFDPLKLPGRM
jgi:hypothetical protein